MGTCLHDKDAPAFRTTLEKEEESMARKDVFFAAGDSAAFTPGKAGEAVYFSG